MTLILPARPQPHRQGVNRTLGSPIQFFETLGRHLDAMLAHHTPEQLSQVNAFLDDLHTTMSAALAEEVAPLRLASPAADTEHGRQR